MKMWEDWSAYHGSNSGVEIKPLLELSNTEMSYWMSKFVLEVRKKDGSPYPPNSLHHQGSIQWGGGGGGPPNVPASPPPPTNPPNAPTLFSRGQVYAQKCIFIIIIMKWVYFISPCTLCKIFALRVGPSHTYFRGGSRIWKWGVLFHTFSTNHAHFVVQS